MPATVALTSLLEYLDDYLRVSEGEDACPNGLQVEGRPEVRHLVTGVSACLELFEAAAARSADAILVHHGLFWRGLPRTLVGVQYARVAALIRDGVSLLAYHLPLDRHPEVGNNSVAAQALGLEALEPFGEAGGLPVGFRGRFPSALPARELVERCRKLYRREPLVFACGPERVRTVAVVSGAAQQGLHEAIACGLDAFITGEVSEWVMNVAREAGTHFLSAGHYATERPGVEALGTHLADRFGIDVSFVDVPNPV